MKSTNLFDSRALCQTKKMFKSFPYWGLEFKEQDKISDVWKLVKIVTKLQTNCIYCD